MTNLQIALIVIAAVFIGGLVVAMHLVELCRCLCDIGKNWRGRPDAVLGLIVIAGWITLTLCAPLREKLFTTIANPEFQNLSAWE